MRDGLRRDGRHDRQLQRPVLPLHRRRPGRLGRAGNSEYGDHGRRLLLRDNNCCKALLRQKSPPRRRRADPLVLPRAHVDGLRHAAVAVLPDLRDPRRLLRIPHLLFQFIDDQVVVRRSRRRCAQHLRAHVRRHRHHLQSCDRHHDRADRLAGLDRHHVRSRRRYGSARRPSVPETRTGYKRSAHKERICSLHK